MRWTGAVLFCVLTACVAAQSQDKSPCLKDNECTPTDACLEGVCADPCRSTQCPMRGGVCKVVGHRPVCSCPVGHVNRDQACVQDTNCRKDNVTYSDGDTFYDGGCTQRCECHLGSLLCEETVCSPGLLPRGFLDPNNDPQCQEREHPAGDECCVLWVCADQTDSLLPRDPVGFNFSTIQTKPVKGAVSESSLGAGNLCETMLCGGNSICDPLSGRCVCLSGYTEDPSDLGIGCQLKDGSSRNIKLLQITSNSIQVQFPDISGGNLMYVTSKLMARKDPPWENAIILEGNEIFTLTGLEPDTQYTLRWKAPDRQYPDVEVSTLEFDNSKPKVIVTSRTHTSAKLSFDQFRPEGYTNGYVVSWKEVHTNSSGHQKVEKARAEKPAEVGRTEGDGGWSSQEIEAVGDPPSIEIKDLKPSTTYAAKISIYGDYPNRLLGSSTEEVEFKTLKGCAYNSSYYGVGKFLLGCEAACTCSVDGEVNCGERCDLPFHLRGMFADDPLCVERAVDETKCCVLVTCASAREDEDSPCQDVNCGPNAECKHEVLREDTTETICVCQEGYTGDPDSAQGCSQTTSGSTETSPPPACLANNSSYRGGETWFDGCDFKCSCTPSLEIICQPRCKIYPEELDPECALKSDPADSCCKILECSGKSNTTSILQPSIPFDGCVYKNATYKEGERFYDGCEQQCQCMGFGDLVCLARCPPTSPELGENCYTLPDLTDSCCNVTVCDKIQQNEDVEKIPELAASASTKNESIAVLSSERPTVLGTGSPVDLESTTTQSPETRSPAGTQTGDLSKTSTSSTEAETTTPETSSLQVTETSTPSGTPSAARLETTVSPLDGAEETTGSAGTSFSMREKVPRGIEEQERVLLGSLTDRLHGVKGEVYLLNDTTLLLQGFSYDGEVQDAFFYVGESDRPDKNGVLVPFPDSRSEDPVPLRAFSSEDVYLQLPASLHTRQISWVSVGDSKTRTNFGDLVWGDRLRQEEARSLQAGAVSGCPHGGKVYRAGEEFYDGCRQFCVCEEAGAEPLCLEIQCPSEFGLDVLSPNCIEWDNHDSFVPSPPTCCPPVPTCLSTGSCEYKNLTVPNYESLPMELTGCEQRCHCENSEVQCQGACYELTITPPSWLPCKANRAVLVPSKERPCCNTWDCAPEVKLNCSALPKSLKGTELRPNNESSILVRFFVPEAVVGHAGHFKVGYSSGFGGIEDHKLWPSQHYRTESGDIDVVEFTESFGPLLPNTEYFIRPSLVIDDCDKKEIVGEIVTTRTLPIGPSKMDTTPLVVYLDLGLFSSDVTHNSAKVSWRHFEPDEKPYIDGVQLRFQILRNDIPLSQVPLTSPFIHRDTNYFVFDNLKPETKYEVELDVIPVPGSRKELYSGLKLEFTTQSYSDVYDFNLELEVAEVKSHSVEVSWCGVPSPDQKFVNIYRIIYHADSPNSVRDESSVFKISKIDSPKRMLITELQPGLQYQIWLEAYLTNGKMTKSNVAEFKTLLAAGSSLAGSAEPNTNLLKSDYYDSMVAVAIIASLAILAFLVILFFYIRRNVTYTHTINKARPASSNSSYDNSGFKDNVSVTTGQTIEMDGLPNGHNGVDKHNP